MRDIRNDCSSALSMTSVENRFQTRLECSLQTHEFISNYANWLRKRRRRMELPKDVSMATNGQWDFRPCRIFAKYRLSRKNPLMRCSNKRRWHLVLIERHLVKTRSKNPMRACSWIEDRWLQRKLHIEDKDNTNVWHRIPFKCLLMWHNNCHGCLFLLYRFFIRHTATQRWLEDQVAARSIPTTSRITHLLHKLCMY